MLQRELLIETPLLDTVVHYSRLAEESGLDGVVCSVHEAEHIYRAVSVDFLTVTPGIRMADDKNNDQVRVATPGYAREKACRRSLSAVRLPRRKILCQPTEE